MYCATLTLVETAAKWACIWSYDCCVEVELTIDVGVKPMEVKGDEVREREVGNVLLIVYDNSATSVMEAVMLKLGYYIEVPIRNRTAACFCEICELC